MKLRRWLFTMWSVLCVTLTVHAKQNMKSDTIKYELKITRENLNITGKTVDFALMVNQQIPAPTLEFTEGNEAEIVVTNGLDSGEEVSIHWHGILLPPEEDGVPYINTPPIFPGKSRTFRFKLRQHGTYWYHSHTMLQEQKGVYGAIVIHPREKKIRAHKEVALVLSDWSNENADQILRNLKKDGDYYQYKKESVRSIFGAAKAGELKTYFVNELDRMGGMDLSDVGYDAFLVNGKREQLFAAAPGETIRLRLINAAASSYFFISLADLPMKVVSADGIDIEPFETKELLMGMAETYDVLFTVPDSKAYELRATVQDVTGFSSFWIGGGEKVFANEKVKPNLYAPMDHGSHKSHDHSKMDHSKMDHSKMDHSKMNHAKASQVFESATVDDIKAQKPTTLPAGAKVHDLKLVLDGDMERYVWHINGKAIHEDRDIFVNEGEIVRFTFENKTMMHHPMHLHGHFFRVINQHGEYSPLKHTVDVSPMSDRTIEFYANEPGQWMLHCHNLYHMKTGMARVIRYMSYQPTFAMKEMERQDPHLHDHWYQTSSILLASNLVEGNYRVSRTWDEIEVSGHAKQDEHWEGEGDLLYRRWLNNYTNLIVGGTAVDHDYRGVLGVGHLLPLLIETNVFVDQHGKLRIDLAKRFQWTSTLASELEYTWRQDEKLKSDLMASVVYGASWHWSAGLYYNGHIWGAGFQYRF